jgi:HAD superfamily hydrolase (TIGR01509 family)
MIRAIIFDCFGVLVTDALQVLVDELRARDAAAADRIRDMVHAANRGMVSIREASAEIGVELGLTYDEYRQKIATGETKNQLLLDYIQELRGQYKTAMLSNIGSAASLGRRFELRELADLFDVVVASGDIGYAKPEAAAYEITADRLGVRLDECVFVDDREPYCDAARGVGMQAIEYHDFAQFQAALQALLT